MLRINCIVGPDQAETLKLEGKLLGPWVEELRHTCQLQDLTSNCIRLDLSAVRFVDAAGAKLLGDLIRQGAQVIACSGYLEELLQLEKR